MKTLLLAIMLFGSCLAYGQKNRGEVGGLDYRMYFKKELSNGNYEATVRYENLYTGTRSTYTLIVTVESNRVTKIHFGNGGYIHTGYNNSDYLYTGGWLAYRYDQDNSIISATTKVTINRGNSIVVYYVSLN